ncbi:hypothetical protein HDU87_002378 [Geranomyces variabilis]|uniref:Transcription factor domain-containing protein n=1 Tax=Geranomyces variabilis TaxID=109894 RepID=A0AAD5TLZ6_9FUNG|nr:hypothetical protein HDU87_002378 [Geranomyces variabilis]
MPYGNANGAGNGGGTTTSTSPDSGSSSFSSPEMMPAGLIDDGYASFPPPRTVVGGGSGGGAAAAAAAPGVGVVGASVVQVYSGGTGLLTTVSSASASAGAAAAAAASDDESASASVHALEMEMSAVPGGGMVAHHAVGRHRGLNGEIVFEELDGLLGGGGGVIRAHKPSGLWELGMQEPEFPFSIDGAAYQSLNMDSSMYRSMINSSNLAASYLAQTRTLPSADLHTHLLDLGLIAQAIQPYGSVQTSEGIHPGVKNVLYAMGAQWSTHPDLNREYGSRIGAVKRFLARAEECFAARGCDTPATVQGMLALGAMFYKMDDGQKACTWTVQACNVAEHMGYNRTAYRAVVKPPGAEDSPLSSSSSSSSSTAVGQNVEEALFESEKDVRWNVYAMALENDTFCALASTFAFTIAEQDVPHLLYEMRPWERTREQQARREAQSREERRTVRMAGPTIFDEGNGGSSSGGGPLPLQRFLASVKPSQDVAFHMQMSFLLRRIMRYLRAPTLVRPDVDEGYVGRGAAACLSLAPPQADANLLHESLMMWYEALPPHCRVWESLAEFRDAPAKRPTHVTASSSPDQDRHCLYVFLLTLSLLHNSPTPAQRREPGQQQYRIDDRRAHAIRASSREMLTISRRATAHLLRVAYAASTLPRPAPLVVDPCTYPAHAAAMPYSAQEGHGGGGGGGGGVPAPPVQIGMLPMVGIGIMLVVQAELGTAITEHFAAKQRGEDVKPPVDQPYADVLADCQEIFLPVLDSQARHSPVDMDYALQIRVLLQELFGNASGGGGIGSEVSILGGKRSMVAGPPTTTTTTTTPHPHPHPQPVSGAPTPQMSPASAPALFYTASNRT